MTTPSYEAGPACLRRVDCTGRRDLVRAFSETYGSPVPRYWTRTRLQSVWPKLIR